MRALLIVYCLAALGCEQNHSLKPTQFDGWKDSDILGKCLISRFDGGVEKKRFHADGTVYITLLKDGDAPVAPIFYWTIDDEGYLYIGIDELSDLSKTKDQMHSGYKSRLISRDNDKLTVEVNGKVDTLYYEHSSCAPI